MVNRSNFSQSAYVSSLQQPMNSRSPGNVRNVLLLELLSL
jgi:hypothetical protein